MAVLAVGFVGIDASTALVETGEGTHAAELLEPASRGRWFGPLGLADGVGDLLSSVVVVLLTLASTAWAFVYPAAFSAVATGVLIGEGAGSRP